MRDKKGKFSTINNIIKQRDTWLEVDVSTKKHPNATMKIGRYDWFSLKAWGMKKVFAGGKRDFPYALCLFEGKNRAVHSLLLPSAESVDHINHNGLDNRRSNIRPATKSQNMRNQLPGKRNKSGTVGVFWCSNHNRWKAQIRVDNKQIHLGSFVNKEDAIKARKEGEKKHFGEYACNV